MPTYVGTIGATAAVTIGARVLAVFPWGQPGDRHLCTRQFFLPPIAAMLPALFVMAPSGMTQLARKSLVSDNAPMLNSVGAGKVLASFSGMMSVCSSVSASGNVS